MTKGPPLYDFKSEAEKQSVAKKDISTPDINRKPSAITFVRSRMFYARAALNAKGGVRFGMRHIRKKQRSLFSRDL
jgi:hypothetical protein